MFKLKLNGSEADGGIREILCLGAHADDIEIGCGGTMLRLLEKASQVRVHWVVLSSDEQRACEAVKSGDLFLKDLEWKRVVVKDFKGSFLPFVGANLKEYFEELKEECAPDLIFTHYRNDAHQDHRVISELTWNTFRDHLILEYEIPKYDGDLGSPNVFVHLDDETCRRKVRYIVECFETQRGKHWFTDDTFLAVLRLRGIESSAQRYAEAFYCRKLVL